MWTIAKRWLPPNLFLPLFLPNNFFEKKLSFFVHKKITTISAVTFPPAFTNQTFDGGSQNPPKIL
jgi:hypothetical protein